MIGTGPLIALCAVLVLVTLLSAVLWLIVVWVQRRNDHLRNGAAELIRLAGDEHRHLHRTTILLLKADQNLLGQAIDSVPLPERNELRKPLAEAAKIQEHQIKAMEQIEMVRPYL